MLERPSVADRLLFVRFLVKTPGIECRSGGASNNYQVVVTFGGPVTFSTAQVTQGTGSVSSTSTNNNQVFINLTGVTNAQTIQVTLVGVNDGTSTASVTIPMSILVGDTNADRFTDAIDASQTKSQSGNAVTNANFREDVNVDGFIDAIDAALVKSKSGTALP
jgi:dockerin type I repeat protein